MISLDRAKEVLEYDCHSGLLKWLKSPCSWISAGDTAGSLHKQTGYIYVVVDQRKYKAHRLAWLLHHGVWPDDAIDHIDGNRQNNRIDNLRAATYAQNQQNRTLDIRNKSGYTGVSWDKGHQKWIAKICFQRKQRTLGVFANVEDAAKAYANAKAELHTFNPINR